MKRTLKITGQMVDNVLENSMIVEIVQRRYGNRKVVDADMVEIKSQACLEQHRSALNNAGEAPAQFEAAQVDKSMFTVRAKLFKSEEWQDIKNHDQQSYRFIQSYALKSNLRACFYRLPLSFYETVEEYLERRKVERAELVELFVDAYEGLKESAREQLGPAFNEKDYDTPSQVRSAFFFDYNIIEEGVPGVLKTLNSTAYKRETAKQKARVAKEVESMVVEVRSGFAALVQSVLKCMEPDKEGKTRTLRSDTLEGLNQFLDLFEGRNLAGDKDLGEMVKEARRTLAGVNSKSLKKNPDSQKLIKDTFERFNGELETMLKDYTGRKVRKLED